MIMNRWFRLPFLICSILPLLPLSASGARATETLFYAGDPVIAFALPDAATNVVQPGWATCLLYKGFTVDDPLGWRVTDLWSNDFLVGGTLLQPFAPTQAVWSIRSGMRQTIPGTLVASGTSHLTISPTGFANWGNHPAFTISVPGLAVDLSPGDYWFQLSPIGRYRDESGNTIDEAGICPMTLGMNSINPSQRDLGGALFYQTATGSSVNYASLHRNYSMGVSGLRLTNAIPEPSTVCLLISSLSACAIARLRRSIKKDANGVAY
jgi:hypothetical protein